MEKPTYEIFVDDGSAERALREVDRVETYLSMAEREEVRLSCKNIVDAHLDAAGRFLSGDPSIAWSAPHVALFKALLNKVVPDLPAQRNETPDFSRPLRTLTRAELDHVLNRTRIVQEIEAQKTPQRAPKRGQGSNPLRQHS